MIERRRLPLFPLPVVLFPGAGMPLHIFEPRYRTMLERCMASDGRFGLIHHDPDESGPFVTDPGRVGCIARITEVRPLDDGRSIILVEGEERFRIDDGLESDEPFYEAVVERYCDLPAMEAKLLHRLRTRSLESFLEVVRCLDCAGGELPAFDLDRELSFQLAPSIQIDPRWQQSLLELRAEADRLERLRAVFHAALDRDPIGDEAPPC